MGRWSVGVAVGVALAAVAAAAWWWRGHQEPPRREPIGPSTIVLVGDSITEQGDWARLLPGRPVANRGYSGYTTEELVPIAAEVAQARPSLVLVLTGTNDIRDRHPPSRTEEHLGRILDRFATDSPGTGVVLQTVLPRADAPEAVAALNERIVHIARDRGLALVDLHPLFDDGAGQLRPAETTDGLHLSEAGYARWAALLDEVLDDLLAAEGGPVITGS